MADEQIIDLEPWRRVNALLLEHYERQSAITRNYTTMVTGAGYAGLLTLWAGSRDHLGPSTVLGAGFLIGISLIIFVAFEILKVSAGQRAELKLMEGIEAHYASPDFDVEMRDRHAAGLAIILPINRFQPLIFAVTMATGFGSALWISAAMAGAAIKIWQSC